MTPPSISRRTLLQGVAGSTAVAVASSLPFEAAAEAAAGPDALGDPRRRSQLGRRARRVAAERDYPARFPAHPTNGDDRRHPYLTVYAKGLPHNEFGEVDRHAYDALVRAYRSGRPSDFDAVPVGTASPRKQLGPVGAFALDLAGADQFALVVPPAPSISSPETAAEMVELYWMAILRDTPFSHYGSSPLAVRAAQELDSLSSYRGLRVGGRVTPDTLFRTPLPGCETGPHLSQFLLKPIQFGTTRYEQRRDVVAAGQDFVTDFTEWLDIQRGKNVPTVRDFQHQRYMWVGRDLAHHTHFDVLYQSYLNAALILLASPSYPSQLQDQGNPYFASRNQVGFNTFGVPHLMSLISAVAILAIKHTEYQQFIVHRRLRPEVVGGRLEVTLARDPGRYPGLIHSDLEHSQAIGESRRKYGSYLLPQGFPEGSPMSPSYQSGHGTVAGACVTVLKAWFNEEAILEAPVEVVNDGSDLVEYTGGPLTVGGELNKLAANIGEGRSFGGVHYRSDNTEAYLLGERIAIQFLREQLKLLPERAALKLTTFDGSRITI